jgi:hypothetical protein
MTTNVIRMVHTTPQPIKTRRMCCVESGLRAGCFCATPARSSRARCAKISRRRNRIAHAKAPVSNRRAITAPVIFPVGSTISEINPIRMKDPSMAVAHHRPIRRATR